MMMSPLRKQVQSLNKELESQNIQIKDLISFLSKSTPKENHLKLNSPRNYLTKITQQKNKINSALEPCVNVNSEKKPVNKQIVQKSKEQSNSARVMKPFYPVKHRHEEVFKLNTGKQVPMTKSVTFHNIQNALTTRKYLKLSRPQKKLNFSCTSCRSPSLTMINSTRQNIPKQPLPNSNPINSTKQKSGSTQKQRIEPVEKPQSLSKKTYNSSSRPKLKQKEKPNSQKKIPFKELGSNQILCKNEVKSIFEKKSIASGTKNKSKLEIKQVKTQQKRKSYKI